MSFEGQIMNKIYHGCTTHYANGKRKLIDFVKCERSLLPTSESFWKQPDTEGCRLLHANEELNKKENIDCWTV